MVKATLRFVRLLAVALLPIASLSAKDLGDYRIGDKADEDIVATVKLSIVDAEGTEALKEKEAQKTPVVIRYYTNAATEMAAKFRQIFNRTHNNFVNAVNREFGHRTLSTNELSSPQFEALRISFQSQTYAFPLSTNRAAAWASGDTDEEYLAGLVSKLRQVMTPMIRPEPFSTEIKPGSPVRLVPTGDTNEMLTAPIAETRGEDIAPDDFVPLTEVKRRFQNLFGPEDRDVVKRLSAILKPNCVVDEYATQQLRAKRTEGLIVVADYEKGDVVAHRGQVIDKKIKMALDQLKEKVVVSQLQELQAKQQAAVGQLQQMVANDKTRDRIPWLIGALAAVVLILAVAVWQLARRKHTVSLLPVPAAGGALEWQQRALTAEQRAEGLQSAARSGLIAHLYRWLSQSLTQRLVSQRRLLMDAQGNAAAEMAELEARLQKVQAPLQDRLAAYERRIAELEKELAVRGEENRELLKAKIEMMRKQLEAERLKNRLEFN